MITREEALKIKQYLESINAINEIASEELKKRWAEVYDLVYVALNGKENAIQRGAR